MELLNFAVTILKQLAQKNMEWSSPGLTCDLFGIISLYSYQPKIQKSLRVHKYKYFKYFLNFQEKATSNENSEIILQLSFSIIAKLTFKNEANQKYFFQKNGHKLIIKIMRGDVKVTNEVMSQALHVLCNCAELVDFKLLLWSYGFVEIVLSRANLELLDRQKEKESLTPKDLSCVWLLLIRQLSKNCEEVSISVSQNKELVTRLIEIVRLDQVSFDAPSSETTRVVALAMQVLANLFKFNLIPSEQVSQLNRTIAKDIDMLCPLLESEQKDSFEHKQKAHFTSGLLELSSFLSFLCPSVESKTFHFPKVKPKKGIY